MRYYDIQINKAGSTQIVKRWTSHPNGTVDPGALNIEVDISVTNYSTPVGLSYLKIWGISRDDIAQATNFNPTNNYNTLFEISIYGGMKAGLPLANPNQSGLLVKGFIWQAFGNWQATEMTLDFLISADASSNAAPKNISFTWKAGTPLSQALAVTLNTAYPGVKQNISISENLVLNHDEYGVYPTVEQFAAAVFSTTHGLINSNYPGVQITLQQGQFYIYDVPGAGPMKQINFTDMVGQPTWIQPYQMQVKFIMRADLQVGDVIKMPVGFTGAPGQVVSQPQVLSQQQDQSIFQSGFQVSSVRHVGDFRQADGNAWVTIVEATALGATQNSAAGN